ncbi:hypothetical protein [Geodermatophilus sp. URMC 65]
MPSWLVHPPLLGPAVLQPLAAVAGPAEVVGFSGAGVVLPDVAAAVGARARGWTVGGDGTGVHLDVADDPGRIADLLG